MRDINKEQLLGNINEMINALEYDSMRSGGKCKLNAGAIVDLYKLKAIHDSKPAAKTSAAKTTK